MSRRENFLPRLVAANLLHSDGKADLHLEEEEDEVRFCHDAVVVV